MHHFLIDTSALVALVDKSDSHHLAVAKFVQIHSLATFFVPDTIFTETMVLTKARLGATPAIELGLALMQSTIFRIIYLTDQDRSMTWDIFSRYRDKDWSYVDCSILAMARRLQVFHVCAFDHHFEQMVELVCEPLRSER